MAYVTRYGSFELLVMPFSLTNVLATFCTMMNQLFKDHLNTTTSSLNDIMVYSQTLEEHVQHLHIIIEILRKNTFYIKLENCYFA